MALTMQRREDNTTCTSRAIGRILWIFALYASVCRGEARDACQGSSKAYAADDNSQRIAARDTKNDISPADAQAEPTVESLLADFDHDGRVGRNEIEQIKENLHQFFDVDDSGDIDSKELKSMSNNDKDVRSAFQKLDRDHDSVISLQELDARWERVGAEMTVDEVADWVSFTVQLPQYAQAFQSNSISGYTFPLLMDHDGSRLAEIGVDSPLHRHQLAVFLKKKYLGMGRKPQAPISVTCSMDASSYTDRTAENTRLNLVQLEWEPAEDTPQRFQLQRRIAGSSEWELVYVGPDTDFMDAIGGMEGNAHHIMYRVTAWNSYGRSPRISVRCDSARNTTPESSASILPHEGHRHVEASWTPSAIATVISIFKMYLWWLDEAIALTLFIILPIRGFIYGDANLVVKWMRKLPPNMPTRVTVEADLNKTSISEAVAVVSWDKPTDNGVPIVQYNVRWTRLKTEEEECKELQAKSLPTSVTVYHLRHGETYRFVVEAVNEFGLSSFSSRSTYMVPMPEFTGRILSQQKSSIEDTILRNQCYLCLRAKRHKVRMPLISKFDRQVLHFCCVCDREFCHYHRGKVHHTKALSCPAVDGRCVCKDCQENNRLPRAASGQ